MKGPSNRSLRRAALRATSRDPLWLGHWLARHRRHEGLTARQQAGLLGVRPGGLVLLSLCQAPSEENFVDDLDVVCRRTGAEKFALARILRQEQALADWHTSPPSSRGWLAAASDAAPPEGGPAPPEPEPPDEESAR